MNEPWRLKSSWKIPAIAALYLEVRSQKRVFANILEFHEHIIKPLNTLHAMFKVYRSMQTKDPRLLSGSDKQFVYRYAEENDIDSQYKVKALSKRAGFGNIKVVC